ncbi:MAG: 30S ribosome-binding factor RbfA [Bacteroidota bacterium]
METTRQQKIARLIQKEIANKILSDGLAHYKGAMITVTKVNVTKDLSLSRIYFSIFTPGNKQEVLDNLKTRIREFRFHLGHHLKNQLRVIPELEFFMDDSLDYIDNIERLLKD